ncbi:unnamed protein product [Soboliphyme baturini]|uniref:Ribosome-binding factor A n=1 Tax=Soboliphyme baturini TaxID=241478 RepID=A0A183J6A2_9BILA|nr:unnamed protein product [Soboliphyme baturini]
MHKAPAKAVVKSIADSEKKFNKVLQVGVEFPGSIQGIPQYFCRLKREKKDSLRVLKGKFGHPRLNTSRKRILVSL